jgi:PAS domain S-box-containing protein
MSSTLDEQRYKSLFESTAVGIVVLDGARHVVDCNAAFCALLGRERAELIGEVVTDFTVPQAGHVPSRFEALSAGEVDRYIIERVFSRPDGTTVRTRITTSAVSGEDDLYISLVDDLAGRDEAEHRLRQQSALLAHAQQIAGVGSWAWYPHECRNAWSPQARRIYGFSDEAAETGDPNLFFDLIHPDDRDEILAKTWDAFRAGRPSSIEHRIRRPDGDRWVREQAEVVCDENGRPMHMLGVVMDITEQKRTEAELQEKAVVLARAHDVAKLGSFTVDVRTRRTHVSQEAARILGEDGPFISGIEEFRERFVPAEERDTWSAALDSAYRRGGDYSIESRMHTVSGTTIWTKVHGRVDLDEFGQPEQAIGVVQDVTEQRRLDEQIRETQKMQAVGLLASGVAHDFNNLLLVIGANAQLAAASAPLETRRELDEILQATERGVTLVRQLLGFSRRNVTEQRPVELNEVARDVRRMLERLISKKVDVELDLTAADTTVLADVTRLEQALLNLAVNARDAMPDGGRITISTENADGEVVLRVSDTGLGMDEATRARIFEPFFTTKSADGGTGLGLPMVYATVNESGGSIDVDSDLGFGTTFTIALPRARTGSPAPKAPRQARAAGRRILLVEDDPMVRAVSAELLVRAGFDVEAVEGGEEALRSFEEGRTYDLVVSDFMMPKMTGLQLMSELRARGVELPVIYTSGYADRVMLPEDGERARFVAKPFSGREVVAAIDSLLREG